MSRLTHLRISNLEAAAGLLDLFVYAEQHWCTWDKLEEKIAEVDYEKFSDKHLDWFIEFMANVVLRVWRRQPDKASSPLNQVEDVGEGFMIKNYDWNGFKFAKQHKAEKELTTKDMVCIFLKDLSEKEIKWLRSKCK